MRVKELEEWEMYVEKRPPIYSSCLLTISHG